MFTPSYFCNIIIGKFTDFKIDYINTNSIIKYKINHRYFDGELFNYFIKNKINSQNIKITKNIKNINNNFKLNINKHYILKYSRYKNFSKFITCIGFFTKYILFKYSSNNFLRIGIIINTRSMENLNKGNYVICKYIKIYRNYNLDKIMNMIKNTILKFKNKNIKTRLSTGLNYILSDFVFNSHKEFTIINNFNCNFYYKNKNYSKLHFIKKIREGNKVIVLNYDNDYYYINDIKDIL